jgi:lia operon protein LiaF
MENRRHSSQGSLIGGLIMIGLGTLFLLDRMRILDFDIGDIFHTWWPMFLIIPGLVMALDPSRRNRSGAFFMITTGAIFQVAELDVFPWWTWRNMWPLLMIVIGGWMLVQHLTGRNEPQGAPPPGSPPQPPHPNPFS